MKIPISRHKCRFHPYPKCLQLLSKRRFRQVVKKQDKTFTMPSFFPYTSIHSTLVCPLVQPITSFFPEKKSSPYIHQNPPPSDKNGLPLAERCHTFLNGFIPSPPFALSTPVQTVLFPSPIMSFSSTSIQTTVPSCSNTTFPLTSAFRTSNNINLHPISSIPLAEHQISAIHFLWARYNEFLSYMATRAVLLNMSMGCGKTRITLEFLSHVQSPLLIFITKPIIEYHIRLEIEKWAPSLRDTLHVVNPKSFLYEIKEIIPRSILVIDECHILTHSKRTKFMKYLLSIVCPPVFIILLSGTPGDASKPLHYFDSATDGNWKENIFDFTWKPSQVISSIQSLQLTKDQDLIYQEFRQQFFASQGRERIHLLNRMRKLIAQWKIPYALTFINQHLSRNHFVLVVSQFANVLMELDMILSPSIKRRRIDGRVEMAQRDIYIQEFQQGLLHVLLGTESAIGHGIDLWQANVLLFMEPNFSADEQRQTTNRLTRLGSKNQNQTIVTLSFDQTLEQKLFEANFSLVPHTEE